MGTRTFVNRFFSLRTYVLSLQHYTCEFLYENRDTTHLMQRPCYQRGSKCQDLAGNRTTRRPPDHRKETQTAVVWSCLPFIRFGQNHLTRHSDRGEKTRQTEEEVGRLHQGMRQAWSSPSPRGQWKTETNGGNWL